MHRVAAERVGEEGAGKEDVEREAFEGEGGEADEAGEGHLEDAVAVEDGKDVDPAGGCPVVPEFPKETAGGAAEQQGDEAAGAAALQIRRQGWPSVVVVDGVEKKDKTCPDGGEEVGGETGRGEQGGQQEDEAQPSRG